MKKIFGIVRLLKDIKRKKDSEYTIDIKQLILFMKRADEVDFKCPWQAEVRDVVVNIVLGAFDELPWYTVCHNKSCQCDLEEVAKIENNKK